MHVVSVLSEWGLTLAFCTFILTFFHEFRRTYIVTRPGIADIRIEVEVSRSLHKSSHVNKKGGFL